MRLGDDSSHKVRKGPEHTVGMNAWERIRKHSQSSRMSKTASDRRLASFFYVSGVIRVLATLSAALRNHHL